MTADWLSCLKLILSQPSLLISMLFIAMLLQSNKKHFLRASCLPTIVQYAVGHRTWSYGRVQKCSCEIITNDTFHLYDALNFSKHFHVSSV